MREKRDSVLKDWADVAALVEECTIPGDYRDQLLEALERLRKQALVGVVCDEMVKTLNELKKAG